MTTRFSHKKKQCEMCEIIVKSHVHLTRILSSQSYKIHYTLKVTRIRYICNL
jgi:hypothetical protein